MNIIYQGLPCSEDELSTLVNELDWALDDDWNCDEECSWEEDSICTEDCIEEDCIVADSILEVISATSAEWADASIVEETCIWEEDFIDADSDLDDETAIVDEAPCKAVPEIFLALTKSLSVPDVFLEPTTPLSSDISLWPSCPTILSRDTVLLLTRGDFWASSWLAFKRFDEAVRADSCLLSEMAVAEDAVAL